MSPDLGPVVFVLFALVVGGLAIWAKVRAAQRRDEIRAMARAQGLSYHRRDLDGTVSLPFDAFRRGDDQGIENVVSGRHGDDDVRVFDLWIMHESTDKDGHRTRSYDHHTCALLRAEGMQFPHLRLSPESLFSRAKDLVGLRDVQLESDEFNRAWDVGCGDARFAYALCDARMMSWLLSLGRDYHLEVMGPLLLVVTDRLHPESFLRLHHLLRAFRERIPTAAREWYGEAR